MSIGQNIRKLRELRNYTQAFMAEKLELSVSGYGKIERDETDVSLNRLKEISKILETDYRNILNFDDKQVFNFTGNQNANGIVQHQNIMNDQNMNSLIKTLAEEVKSIHLFIHNFMDKIYNQQNNNAQSD